LKKLVSLLSMLILVVITGVIVYLGATLFDVSRRVTVNPYFMQPADFSTERTGRPVNIATLNEDFKRTRLIAKFAMEYFYVIPDANNIALRTANGGPLRFLSSAEVFNEWKTNVAPVLSKMAESGMLQRVIVHQRDGAPDIVKSGDYYVVTYDLVTYSRSNTLAAAPTVSRNNQLRLRILDDLAAKKARDFWPGTATPFDVEDFLEAGGDPSGIFRFQVTEVRQ